MKEREELEGALDRAEAAEAERDKLIEERDKMAERVRALEDRLGQIGDPWICGFMEEKR